MRQSDAPRIDPGLRDIFKLLFVVKMPFHLGHVGEMEEFGLQKSCENTITRSRREPSCYVLRSC